MIKNNKTTFKIIFSNKDLSGPIYHLVWLRKDKETSPSLIPMSKG